MSNSGDRLLTLEEVGERMNRCARVVKKLLAAAPEIRPIKIGRTLMLIEEDYLRLIEALRAPAVPSGRVRQTVTRINAHPKRVRSAMDELLDVCRKPQRKGG